MATVGLQGSSRGFSDAMMNVERIRSQVGGTAFFVDFSPVVDDIKRVLSTASVDIQRSATHNALNSVCGPVLTEVRRDVARQTSIPYGRVSRRIWGDRAHPNRLSYIIHAEDTATPLRDFMRGGKSGDKKVTVFVWGKQRTLKKNVFLVDFGKGPTPVKRVAKHQGTRGKKIGRLGAKALYGPIIPKEMIRENTPSMQTLRAVVPVKLIPRLEHEIAQAFLRAAKSGGSFVGPLRDRGVDKRYGSTYRV